MPNDLQAMHLSGATGTAIATTSPPMRKPPHPSRRLGLVDANLAANVTLLLAILAPIVVLDWERLARSVSAAHAPDLGTLLAAEPTTMLHLVSVLLATGLGFYLLFGKKGARMHRVLGWTWALLVTAGAISSIFLHREDMGWSVFHAFTVLTMLVLPLALVAARRHRVRWHAALMIYLVVNVLFGSGIFAAYPGFTERLLVRAIFQ